MKTSIIVTLFNCEKYIEKCARSLLEQTQKEIEFVFVNDASSDKSMENLTRAIDYHSNRKPSIKVINFKKNGGVSNARRIGLKYATGEYIIHADSDDWVDSDMYEQLYKKAKETDADIVGCNFRHEYPDKQYDFIQQYGDSKEENIRRLIDGRIFPSLCTAIIRRKLIEDNNITFPEGLNMGEDLFFNLQAYLCANKIEYVNFAPYHYRHTEDSSCVQRTRKSIDSDIAIANRIETLMRGKGLYEKYSFEIEYRKFVSKLPLVQNFNNRQEYKEWLQIYPETHKYIWRFKRLDWKLRLELWFAAHHMYIISQEISKFLSWQHQLRRP